MALRSCELHARNDDEHHKSTAEYWRKFYDWSCECVTVIGVVVDSCVSECYVAPPSDDHSYAHRTSGGRQAAPEPQQPSLFRRSAESSTPRPCTFTTDSVQLFDLLHNDCSGLLGSCSQYHLSTVQYSLYFQFFTTFHSRMNTIPKRPHFTHYFRSISK